ncbi:MAG: hypothetical protein ABSA05_06565 [Opitutaceae bacterium]|jgi:hypothetical protein
MKTYRNLLLLTTVASPAILFLSGCSKTDTTSTTVDKVQADAKAVATDVGNAASDSWDAIKNFTFERRSDFSNGINRMAKQLDDDTREMRAKVAGAPDAASKDRVAAVKEYDDARADLKSKLSDLDNSTADTWADAKAGVVKAWNRVQAAVAKMKSSVDS